MSVLAGEPCIHVSGQCGGGGGGGFYGGGGQGGQHWFGGVFTLPNLKCKDLFKTVEKLSCKSICFNDIMYAA